MREKEGKGGGEGGTRKEGEEKERREEEEGDGRGGGWAGIYFVKLSRPMVVCCITSRLIDRFKPMLNFLI